MWLHSLLLSIALSCCCSAELPGPPMIHLNSNFLPNRSDAVLAAGSAFSLSCHGNGLVHWSSSAFRLQFEDSLPDPVQVSRADPRHTGTYRCGYANRSLEHLHTWIHLYITDPAHPSSVFVTPRSSSPILKEGQDYLFRCLLTDPSLTNLTLQSEDRGRGLPPGMKVTFDPRSGALIQHPQRSFSGRYTCSGWKDGRLFRSTPVDLLVVPSKSVCHLSAELVRLEGELFEVTCLSSNPSHFYNLTWTHPQIQVRGQRRRYGNNQLYINSTLSVSPVHLHHSGPYTCTAVNEAGVATATTQLTVLGTSANVSRVEAYEGHDVTLTFVMEAYPPIRSQHWTTPEHITNDNNTVYQESNAANGYRLAGRGTFKSFLSSGSPTVAISVENTTLTCSSSGYPLPTILWLTCPGVQPTCANVSTNQVPSAGVTSQADEEVRTHLPLSSDDDVTFECVSSNLVGESRVVFSPERLVVFTPALIGALSVIVVLLLLLLVVFYRCRQQPKYEIRWKIIESTDGNNYTFVDPTQLPYNHKWEFPRDKLRLGAVLGSGAFGKVVEATAYGLETDNKVTRVAVKMLKPSAHSEEREALMSELKILSHLGYHDNIVNLLGACTQGGPMLMITEYCSHGDLLNFLRAHADDIMASMLNVDNLEDKVFYKNMAAQNGRLRSDSGISCCSEYQEMQPFLSSGRSHLDNLSVSDLMRFSHQVAQGLDFLSTRNCIHRDVAARNVLLTDHHVAKICDFGLARDICNDDSYIVQGNARLPVKWMAPESIFQCVYTLQSDVWSYGVLLWEIFSLGKSPYPNVSVDTNFYKMIKDGGHMRRPDFAPAEMYHLMTLCWSLEPTDRPTFKAIGQLISRLLPSNKEASSHHSEQVSHVPERSVKHKHICSDLTSCPAPQSATRMRRRTQRTSTSCHDPLVQSELSEHELTSCDQ
uniref:receptor protein-tyrosine kinase n=1 Tax=Amphiprion ocellaris TaxID=80972 RepID=A0AAQ5ZNN5_AMPOC